MKRAPAVQVLMIYVLSEHFFDSWASIIVYSLSLCLLSILGRFAQSLESWHY